MTLAQLRSFAIARSLFAPVTLPRAIERLGFVQADPIRAPARAQDLTLRHRVTGYRAGDLGRQYADLAIEEDFFVNYGFLPRAVAELLHPRGSRARNARRVTRILDVVRELGEVHPRVVEQRLKLGTVTNYWGGSSNATTHLLDGMHYGGLLRVVRREAGIRIYGERSLPPSETTARARADALVALAIDKYAPLPVASLQGLTTRLRNAVPAIAKELTVALVRAKEALPRARIDGTDWIWREEPEAEEPVERVRFLAPFDPVVWDRRRFEIFWGWAYRFEAYTPEKKRKHGYYALPLLWRDRVIGWANVAADGSAQLGFVSGKRPRDRAYARELEAEMERMKTFLRQ